MTAHQERLAAQSERQRPTDVEHEAVAGPGSAAALGAAVAVDVSRQVGVEEGEARYLPGGSHAGQIFEDVGVGAEVDATDDRNVPDRPQVEIPARHLAEAQGWIPLAIEVLVVETVPIAVVEDVEKKETVSEPPARRMLDSENGGVFPSAGERVGELAVLVVEFNLCGCRRSGGQHQADARNASQQSPQVTVSGHGVRLPGIP